MNNNVAGASSSVDQSSREQDAPAIPRLRFPKFQGNEWKRKKLKDVAPLQRGFDLPSDLIQPGNIPIVYSNGIQKYHETGMAKAPGLVTGRSGTIGKLHFIEHGEYWPHNTSLWVTDFKGNAPKFVYFLFQSIGIERFSSGSGVPTLNRNDVHAFCTAVPTLPEQQRIADCLSSLDALIAAQARKVDALKTHKKGLMQQLFPRDGETQPRLRFPEFQDAGEWEVRNVMQFAKVTTGAKDTQNKVEGGLYPFFVRSQSVERIDSYSFDCEAVLTSGDGVGVGKNFHYINDKFDFHQRVYCIYDFAVDVCGLFFYLYFSEHFGERVMRMSAKNSVDSVRMAMITEMPILFPSLPEQQRIADCLSSLDAVINAATQRLAALKTHKQGLMQQLFPAPADAAV